MNTNEEIRCGFKVSKKRKDLWLKELQILEWFKKICVEHKLRYFAIDGTLLGAVRHKGFIPWDDDIDLGMFREDYEKLLCIAKDISDDNYFVQSTYTDSLIRNHIQIRAQNSTCLIKDDYKAKYNCGIFIDIFPLDFVPSEQGELIKFYDKLKRHYSLITPPRKKAGFSNKKSYLYFVYNTFFYPLKILFYKIKVFFKGGKKRSFLKFEKLCSNYNNSNSNLVSFVSFNSIISNYDIVFDINWFKNLIDLPFENTTVTCPKEYARILSKEYGNYNEFKQGGSAHGDIFVDTQNEYKKYTKLNRKKYIELFNQSY